MFWVSPYSWKFLLTGDGYATAVSVLPEATSYTVYQETTGSSEAGIMDTFELSSIYSKLSNYSFSAGTVNFRIGAASEDIMDAFKLENPHSGGFVVDNVAQYNSYNLYFNDGQMELLFTPFNEYLYSVSFSGSNGFFTDMFGFSVGHNYPNFDELLTEKLGSNKYRVDPPKCNYDIYFDADGNVISVDDYYDFQGFSLHYEFYAGDGTLTSVRFDNDVLAKLGRQNKIEVPKILTNNLVSGTYEGFVSSTEPHYVPEDCTGVWKPQSEDDLILIIYQHQNNTISFVIEAYKFAYGSKNIHQYATTKVENVSIDEGVANFNYVDSFGNSGTGKLTFYEDRVHFWIDIKDHPGNFGIEAGHLSNGNVGLTALSFLYKKGELSELEYFSPYDY